MRIAVISDTHLRSGEVLPTSLVQALTLADHILHAGDITSMDCLRALREIAPVTAVSGNTDGFPLTEVLSPREMVVLDGLRIGVIHGGGSVSDIESRVLRAFEEDHLDLIVFGHTHVPTHRRLREKTLLNPGSACDPLRSGRRTMAWIDTETREITFQEL